LSSVLFPIVTALLIGAGIWGYQENQEKNAILLKAENQYQRAFHNLSYHMDELHGEIANALAANSASADYHRRCLVNVWRITSEAQNEIAQLPLTLLPFHETEKFLAQIADFSYRAALRDMAVEPLSEQEWQALRELYRRSKEIAAEVRGVQEQVIAHNLRWMDVESALASQSQNTDNMIIDGFSLVNQKVTEYPEVEFGPEEPELFRTQGYKQLSGRAVTPDEVREKARKFFQLDDGRKLQVTENGQGTEYASYTVTDGTLKADFSKRGGHLLWFLNSRDVSEPTVSVEQAVGLAQQFLKQRGFDDEMVPVSYDAYNGVASLTMARKLGDVVVYPEKLSVSVALDNGEVIGLQAVDYVLKNNKERRIPEAKLTAEQARAKLNPEFRVTEQTKALIEDGRGKEVLAYAFIGTFMDEDFRIYLDADTGKEIRMERIPGVEKEI
jgi:spore germination protein